MLTFLVALILIYIGFKLVAKLTPAKLVSNLDQKVVFITGCDSGIGHQLARRFHELGFVVFAGCLDVYSDGARALQAVHDEEPNESTTQTPNRMHIVQIDVTQTESVQAAVAELEEFLKNNESLSFHCLINNAGVCIAGEFDLFTWPHIEQVLNVNINGTIRTVKLFLDLVTRHQSRILIVGSVNGLFAYPGISTYCASKSALNAFAKSLRFELYKFGSKVCVINPGDYAKNTNVMANQMNYFEQMMENLTPERREAYGEAYLARFKELLVSGVGVTAGNDPEKELFADFDRMVLHQNPPAEILTIVPLLNQVILKVFFDVLPISVQVFIYQQVFNRLMGVNINGYQ